MFNRPIWCSPRFVDIKLYKIYMIFKLQYHGVVKLLICFSSILNVVGAEGGVNHRM